MNTKSAIGWNIDATNEEVVRESIEWDDDLSQEGDPESVLTPDRRTRVDECHYAPGGKYRGVLKIHVKYSQNEGSWNAGTGWLLRDDLVVTAGHVVLSKLKKRALYLNAYAGYHGLGSVCKPNVQKRQANRVVILKAYYQNQSFLHDIAFVRLREPFENVQPFTHCDTPEQGSSSLGIVGYPADKDCNDARDVGPNMYEEFAHTSWDLHKSSTNLLQYEISTFGGQSGAPVIFDIVKSQCIGTHIQGFREHNPQKNSASTIGGHYGNPYNALVGAIEKKPLHISGGVWEVPLSRKSSSENQNRKDPQHTSKSSAQPVSSLPGPSTQSRRKEDVYATLQQYDTLFLVDDSGSMMYDDSVKGSKWEKTKRVMADITTIAAKHNSDGVEVQFFNFSPRERKNLLRSAEEVMRLFEDVKTYGPSPIADRLDQVLNEYCYEFEKNRRIKSLNLIVLTDGEPSPHQDVEKIIVKYARELKKLKAHSLKVGIQFVQIGNDRKATAYFKRLDDNLQIRYNLDRDMVDTVLWVEGGSEPLHQKILLGGILRQIDNRTI